ncbi:TFIIB-type zinc ribbon-containing protein [Actinokineospora auranticolor]|uniref:Uncharacterized protein n=1 Tax=Actinokineospora auranticolor TaxID=155976 RepID=A0A2S6GMN8_9PSEU|nr:hypothetical protein [Actinokineospora auranticolor]PPK66498.1 hypothetical protein CLV40_110202 [Actinokineospora auranticolor]
MAGERFRDPMTSLYSLAGEAIDVVCPRCGKRAVDVPRPVDGEFVFRWPRTLTCVHCAYGKTWEPGVSRWGGPCDPFFDTPLWLRSPWRGHTLWALNRTHLDLLEHHIAARLREHPGGGLSMLARLPAWMTAAKNRDGMVRVLRELRATLD